MKSIAVLTAVFLMTAVAPQSVCAQSADDAVGTWRHPENGSHIRLYKCGSNLCGSIAKVTDGQKVDFKNPNKSKRRRAIIGLRILTARKTGAKKWSGSLYNRKDGKTYSGTVIVVSRNALSLSGCAYGVFCKSAVWSRIR
ncbi:MAG: DUF2147 domain-containing protein [Alphaproteobacteria bacterium]|nr:DUF2147 domain-containing protein [Alphaproteobacteria bacterium]